MKTVVFTGVSGLLGKYFLNTSPSQYKIIGIYNKTVNQVDKHKNLFKLDITEKETVINFFKKKAPSIVIHAASIGNVDFCESHPDLAQKINIEGTSNILEACRAIGAKIIFTSSNAVYNGKNPPYGETSERLPVDIYGKTKKEGEDMIISSEVSYVILRLMTMYGWQPVGARSNPVSWIIENLRKAKEINVVNDIINNHLWAGQAAEVLWKCITSDVVNEEFNVAGGESVSRYDLALRVASVFDLDPSLINPVPSSFFPSVAPRPRDTSFDTNKLSNALRIKPLTIREGLQKMREEKEFS